jgi:multidrug efflux pump subunit AcrB
MLTRFCFLTVASAIAAVGFKCPAPARAAQADDPVLVVAASYPGANAQVVADTVAAPIERQINGAEGLLRIESTSGNDGKYTARLYFQRKTDAKSAMKLVQRRVALAEPVLPDVVRRNKVSLKVGKAGAGPGQVTIAVIDRRDHGRDALRKLAGAVVKRLAAEGALLKPQVFPPEAKQGSIDLQRAASAFRPVPLAELFKAFRAADSAGKPGSMKKPIVRDKGRRGDVPAIKEACASSAVYRVDLYPAIRITGAPPEGKSVAAAAARCVDLAKAEMKRLSSRGFAVETLSAK